MASLHARHQRTCPLFEYRRFDDRSQGCTCRGGPTYVVVVPQGRKRRKLSVGKNRKVALQAVRRVAVEVDEGTYRPQLNIKFESWSEKWLESLARPKESTVESYHSSMVWARRAFGGKLVRHLTPGDVVHMLGLMRADRLSASTQSKHLRVLGACLTSAMAHGYAARNPVKELPDSEKPRAGKREAAFFTNEELPQLFAEVPEGVYRTLFLVALKTGMRQGELLALTWGDVNLAASTIHLSRSYRDGRLSTTKTHEARDLALTDDVIELLGEWWGECGRPAESNVLVFPGETGSGYISSSTVLKRELYPAMKRAGIPRECPDGRTHEKRTFHSFRHTYAKRALESGAQITWLSRHLGHATTKMTTDTYGHWEKDERAKQAKLLEGAFGV
jgi:integrase